MNEKTLRKLRTGGGEGLCAASAVSRRRRWREMCRGRGLRSEFSLLVLVVRIKEAILRELISGFFQKKSFRLWGRLRIGWIGFDGRFGLPSKNTTTFKKKFSKIDKKFVSQSILEVGHYLSVRCI